MPRKEPRDYAKENREYHSKPIVKAKRANRNKARREAIASGQAHKGDGTHVDHIDGNALNNAKSNRRVVSAKTNLRKG
jgi:hypothetical protein